MGQQLETLLRDLSRSVDSTAKAVELYLKRVDQLEERQGDVRDRLTAIETGSKIELDHGNRENERIQARLKEGEQEFAKLRSEAEKAVRAAEAAALRIQELEKQLREETRTGKKRINWKRVFIGALPGILSAAALWLIQHLYFLAKLAEAAKAKGGHP